MSGRTAPGKVKQSSISQHQARPRRTGQGDKRSASVEKGWTKRNKVWHCQQNWIGVAGRALLDSAEPGRIVQGQFGYG